jgi:hypothetical protein
VTVRTTLAPVTEIMPDRCTPEYERVLAKLGALLPYRRARAVLVDFFLIGDAPAIDTIHQRTLQVGARLEHEAIAVPPSIPTSEAEAIECPSTLVTCVHCGATRRGALRYL